MNRSIRVEFWNYSGVEYTFGGEYFDCGSWADSKYKQRTIPVKGKQCPHSRQSMLNSPKKADAKKKKSVVLDEPTPSTGSTSLPLADSFADISPDEVPGVCSVRFVNSSFMYGVAGYVYYTGSDGSCLEVAFSSPIVGTNKFTARRWDSFSGNAMPLYENAPEMIPPGYRVRTKTSNLGWLTSSITSEKCAVRILIPDMHSGGEDPVIQLIASSPLCPSYQVLSSNGNVEKPSGGLGVERSFQITVENQSEEEFICDGDLLMGGMWAGKKPRIKPKTSTKLHFRTEALVSGIQGLCWYVNARDMTKYLCFCFSNPVVGEGIFYASCGHPPAELKEVLETSTATCISMQGRLQDRKELGVAWLVQEVGNGNKVKVNILENPRSVDWSLYPAPKPKRKSKRATMAGASEASSPETKAPEIGVQAKTSQSASATRTAAASVPQFVKNEDKSDPPSSTEDKEPVPVVENTYSLALRKEDANAEHDQAAQLLDQTRPKDALQGIGQGLMAAGGGILAGVGALIVQPVMGAQQDGVAGFFSGLGQGAKTALITTTGGVAVGATQIVRGVMNTPEALSQGANMKWDQELGKWVDDTVNMRDLEQGKLEDSESEDEDAAGLREKFGHNVLETEYYDLIGVPPSATPSEIKKGYYKKALLTHPDKNRDDPNAHEKFQQLGQAYQILSNPELREVYDRKGKSGLNPEQMPNIDAHIFFAVLFGSEKFDPYVGKLSIASLADSLVGKLQKGEKKAEEWDAKNLDFGDSKRQKRNQFRREVRLTTRLREKLDQWVMMRDEKAFVAAVAVEAKDLKTASFGTRLLQTIGFIYENKAEQYLGEQGGEWSFFSSAGWKETGVSTQRKLAMGTKMAKGAMALKKVHDMMEEKDEDAEGTEDTEPGPKMEDDSVGSKLNPDGSASNNEVFKSNADGTPKSKKSSKKSVDSGVYVTQEDADAAAASSNVAKKKSAAPEFIVRNDGTILNPDGSKIDPDGNFVPAPANMTPETRAALDKEFAEHKLKMTQEKKEAKSKEAMRHLETSIPLLLEILWEVSANDIEKTLNVVCKLFLHDVSVPWIIRMRRAAALQRLGRIFQDIAASEDEELSEQETKQKIEEAFMSMATRPTEDKKKKRAS